MSGAVPLAPTALDHLVDRLQRRAPRVVRATDRLVTAATAAAAALDVALWRTDRVVDTGRLTVSVAVVVPLLGAVAVVAVALRRRHPVGALANLAGSAITVTAASWVIGSHLPPSFGSLLGLGVLTVGVLRHEPGRRAVALAALAGIAVAAEALRPMVAAAGYLLVVCLGAFAVAVGIGVYLRWSDWRRAAAADAARAEERLEMARELHDLVGHHVTGMVVQAQAARHVADAHPEAAVEALARIEASGAEAMTALRHVVGGLRQDPATTPAATWDDVDRLIAAAIDHGDPVHAVIDPAVRATAPSLAASAHRIIAESLTNVRRHAGAMSRVEVAVRLDGDLLVLTVADDGHGGGDPRPDSFGIVGLRERATALGGTLDAGPGPDGGWLVRAVLPCGGAR